MADSMKASTVEPLFKSSANCADIAGGALIADAFQPPVFEIDQLSHITREMAAAYGYCQKTIRSEASKDASPIRMRRNLNKRREFIDRQRQRRMVHRKHMVQERKSYD
jgi:hypothetical protein